MPQLGWYHIETGKEIFPEVVSHQAYLSMVLQALWAAHQHSGEEHHLVDVTSGIIFLSTPHTTSIEDKRWENWKRILKSSRKDASKIPQSKEDIRSLAEVCQNFEYLSLPIPVLSVFETHASRVRDGILHSVRGNRNSSIVSPSSKLMKGSAS